MRIILTQIIKNALKSRLTDDDVVYNVTTVVIMFIKIRLLDVHTC